MNKKVKHFLERRKETKKTRRKEGRGGRNTVHVNFLLIFVSLNRKY